MVAHVAAQVFTERSHQEFWIALLGVESRYESSARSPAGAVGLGQLMPQFAKDFGAACGLPDVSEKDLTDDFTNALLSACYFKSLIDSHDRSIPMALVAYNAGAYSKSLERAKAGGSPVEETSAYVTRIWIKKNQNERK
jgi:soluble lytic murein transglycosylase-like protein